MKRDLIILSFLCMVTNSVVAYTLTIKNTTNEYLEAQVEYVGKFCAKDTLRINPKKTVNKEQGLCCIRRIRIRKTSRGADRKVYYFNPQVTGGGVSCRSNVLTVSKTPDGSLFIQQKSLDKKASLKQYTLQVHNKTKSMLKIEVTHQAPGVCADGSVLVPAGKQKLYRTPQASGLTYRLTTRCCITTVRATTVSGRKPGATKIYEPSKTNILGGSCRDNAIVVYENPDGSLRIGKK